MECKNCNENLYGQEKFCSNCGQKNINTLNLKYLFTEVVDNIFDLDSTLYRTIKYLILRPGFLSKEFMEGKRKRSVPPIRLYILFSVLFFFMISVMDFSESTTTESTEEDNRSSLTINTNQSTDSGSVSVPVAELKKMDYEGTLEHYLDSITADQNQFMEYFIRKSVKSNIDGDGFGDIILNQISLFLLIFIPFLALLYATCLSGSKRGFIGHLIFNLHLNSFVILSLIVYMIVDNFIENDTLSLVLATIVVLFGQFYFIKAIMVFYTRKWWVAMYKYFILIFGYLVLGLVFMLFVIASSMVML